jgi:pimeloyl-ACP methyl ester carboxylesterase
MAEGTIVVDGRTVGFAEFGVPGGTPVLWCHGGPGSRLEPSILNGQASEQGVRIVGIDRPGYGLSSVDEGRTIGAWVPDALAMADHLALETFYAVGVSTGGAYALALAALSPERVSGVVACCAMTDMAFQPARATMSVEVSDLWDAPDRAAAIDVALGHFGEDGSRMLEMDEGAPPLASADLALLVDPEYLAYLMETMPASFANGVEGYADDRLADGPGWSTFDVGSVRCPVTVLHGSDDTIVDVSQADHTVSLVPSAELHVVEGLGHLSIIAEVLPALSDLMNR